MGQGEAGAPRRESCSTEKQARAYLDNVETNRIQRYSRYSFKGTALKKGAKWHVLLRVVFKRQSQHRPKASRVLYIDENPPLVRVIGESCTRFSCLTEPLRF